MQIGTSHFPKNVKIFEVGPRDGLQNERTPIPTDKKIAFINQLSDSGLQDIEITSFVSPKAVPQLADAVDVAQGISKKPGINYWTLVPNKKGLERAVSAGIRHIAVFTAASESFVKKNINMTVGESLEAFRAIAQDATREGMAIRGYVSTAFFCPFEGKVSGTKVLEVSERLIEMGVAEISLGDTIGKASPTDVYDTVGPILDKIPHGKVAIHLHDTYGRGLANALAALQLGVTTFDSSAGGLGGCPFAPGASGNLATEDLVDMLHGMGIETGVNPQTIAEASTLISESLGRDLPSHIWQRLKSASQATP